MFPLGEEVTLSDTFLGISVGFELLKVELS